MTARTPPPLSESDRPDVLQSLRDGWSLDDAARGFRRKGADVLADADANGWRGDLDAAIADGQRQAASDAPAPTVAPSPPVETAESRRAQWVKAALATQAQSPPEAPAVAKPSKRASEATDDGAPDWPRIIEAADALAPGPFGFVLYQEERLAASGQNFPPLSPFTLYTIDGFFFSGKRWLLIMAGRGFGKSTLTSRLATAIGYGVTRRAAPGPAWVCPLVSVLPVDADRRLEDIQQILLHAYRCDPKEAKIALGKSTIAAKDPSGCALAWVSSASTIGNVSGPSSFAALVDEEEKILYGRAGAIIGSLAFTFRSRQRVYGMRVSSAMATTDTLAGDCAKGQTITNFVATLGPFLDDAVAGLLAVAAWEERGDIANRREPNAEAARAIRAHAATLTADSWQIPSWLGHPTIGIPTDAEGRPVDVPWGPGDAAIATRVDAEAVPEKARDGLPPWRFWLRECASLPTGAEATWETDGPFEVVCDGGRYAGEIAEERDYE